VLKKAGIIVATAAAGVLAFTPLAFAGEGHHDADKNYGKKDHHAKVVEPASNTSTGNLSNDCQFGNQSGDAAQLQDGGSSLLGVASVLVGTVTNAASQVNALNCTNVNVSDLVDNNSNNDTREAEQTFVHDSFNR
jgi:hypothetical protein